MNSLAGEVVSVDEDAASRISIEEFGNLDFRSNSSEQMLHVHRAAPEAFRSLEDFVFHSSRLNLLGMDRSHWEGYFRALALDPLTLVQWREFTDEYCSGLSVPAPVFHEVRGSFLEAVKLSREWNDTSALLVTTEELKAVYWSTSA
ncbi:hypothetical protein [Corallococcus exiguus]|uniref:hypothetical protein n=1 Tax=Corallococcus exiguus TaxID=83462 RepID=UPI0014714C28|nr:hypothetical protein [Corallococcus exiguus]NNB91288.1 hypothetical protein [Corallococcus exiguus]